jgi:hypothetical protein
MEKITEEKIKPREFTRFEWRFDDTMMCVLTKNLARKIHADDRKSVLIGAYWLSHML